MKAQSAPLRSVDIATLKAKAVGYRKLILEILKDAKSGHPGGSLSIVEILLSLYQYKLRYRPQDPHWEDRDLLVISKGHASPAVYVALADAGFFPKEELKTFRKLNSRLQGHVHFKAPGVEFNTGSLGHGLSVANGMALGARLKGKGAKIYCLLGDGEIQEGSVWEAAMTAAHHRLDNICGIIDYNKVQENGPTNEIKNLEPLRAKWEAFGWHTIEVNGHDLSELMAALDACDLIKSKPTMIIAHTVKGKGVSFMEGDRNWHGKAPSEEQFQAAMVELSRHS